MRGSTSECVSRGAPTAITGKEYGVKRRLGTLQSLTSFEGKAILDVGCGVAAYSKIVKKYGAKIVVGIDINREYLGEAILDNLVLGDAHALPFRDSCFDITLMIEVLEHLSYESRALKECRRVLVEGGLLFLTLPNKFYPFETHGLKMGSITIPNMLGVGIPFLSWIPSFVRKRVETARIYTLRNVTKLLHEIGFKLVKVDYMMPPLDKLNNQKLAEILRRLLSKLETTWLKYFACHIIVVASKNIPARAKVSKKIKVKAWLHNFEENLG
jgi:ubiquinone/menaquinone biosynthesis C-methylase UbiE